MKLSEIDKSKLPVKITRGGLIYTVKYVGDYYAVLNNELGAEITFDASCDIWSPYQEQKPKRALYAYKTKRGDEWAVSSFFYKSDKEFIDYMSDVEEFECQRLLWSEVEV